jgi:hypothetical protein
MLVSFLAYSLTLQIEVMRLSEIFVDFHCTVHYYILGDRTWIQYKSVLIEREGSATLYTTVHAPHSAVIMWCVTNLHYVQKSSQEDPARSILLFFFPSTPKSQK